MSERVLMIEDDESLSSMVAEYLARIGFEVIASARAVPGLDRLRREPFDALLLDVMLPDGDGLDLCRRRGAGRRAALRPPRDRPGRALVRVDAEERSLTGHQFDLLVALAQSAGRVLSRDTLMRRVRGESLDAFDSSIDVHVSRIRAAIEDDSKHPRRILTVRGTGYVFARSQDGDG